VPLRNSPESKEKVREYVSKQFKISVILLRSYLLHLVPQVLQVIAMILRLLMGCVIENQPAGNKCEQYLNKFEFDSFLHFLNAQHIAQRFLDVLAFMHAQTSISLQKKPMLKMLILYLKISHHHLKLHIENPSVSPFSARNNTTISTQKSITYG